MTFTANIARKYAEEARRRAIQLEMAAPLGFERLYETERRECVAIWNAFCREEQARLDAPKPVSYAQIMPGIWVETC